LPWRSKVGSAILIEVARRRRPLAVASSDFDEVSGFKQGVPGEMQLLLSMPVVETYSDELAVTFPNTPGKIIRPVINATIANIFSRFVMTPSFQVLVLRKT
jgi:hypothetical protein